MLKVNSAFRIRDIRVYISRKELQNGKWK